MSAPKFIADRIFSLSKENLSSTVMRLAVTSVALAIIVMLIAWAVVVGFKNQIRDKVISFNHARLVRHHLVMRNATNGIQPTD